MTKLTILMPCLNEAETLKKCIDKANKWIELSKIDAEELISDNGSTDGSQEIAKSLGARVVDAPEKGYGAALHFGSMQAKGEYIIMGDSDDSYDFSKLDNFIEQLDAGYDLVMGNRFLGGIEPGAMPWKNKYIGNPILSWIGRVLFRCPAKDFHCGLRGFSKKAFLKMDLRTTGMEFASEMVIKANLMGMRICEVPTTLSKDGRSRPPHLRPWKDGWRHLRFMIIFSPRWLFIYPGLSLLFISMACYSSLLFGPVSFDGVTFDIHTMLYAQTGVMIGLISCCFGLLVRMFGIREGLLPNHGLMDTVQSKAVLEIGCILSIILVIIGVYIGMDTLDFWANNSFGNITYGILLRKISLSTIVMITGFMMFFMSLTAGFLSLPLKHSNK